MLVSVDAIEHDRPDRVIEVLGKRDRWQPVLHRLGARTLHRPDRGVPGPLAVYRSQPVSPRASEFCPGEGLCHRCLSGPIEDGVCDG
jgi:hypothetical protein